MLGRFGLAEKMSCVSLKVILLCTVLPFSFDFLIAISVSPLTPLIMEQRVKFSVLSFVDPSHWYRPFSEAWGLVLIVNNQGVKGKRSARNALGPMQQIEFLWVLEVPVSCRANDCTKHFVKGGDTRFYKYLREPECQRRWILAARRCDWAPTERNQALPHITALKVAVIRSDDS